MKKDCKKKSWKVNHQKYARNAKKEVTNDFKEIRWNYEILSEHVKYSIEIDTQLNESALGSARFESAFERTT